MFNSRPWKVPRFLNPLSRTLSSCYDSPTLQTTFKGCDTYPGPIMPDKTALVSADTSTLPATLAPEVKLADLYKAERMSNDMAQPKQANATTASSTAVDNPLAQDNSPKDCNVAPKKKHGYKHKISVLKSANHSLWAKLRGFRDAKKLNLWNRKGKEQKELTTEQEQTSTPQIAMADATTESEGSCGDGRKDWEAIRAIPDYKFCHLLLRCLNESGERPMPLEVCQVGQRREGGFHLAVFVYIFRHKKLEEWVIKVPAHGTASFWTKEDAYMMRREVEIMRQISRNTSMLVPKIKDFCTGLDDELGAPWILMEKLPGRPAYEIWFDESYSRDTAYLRAASPTNETHRRRVNFLKSLASQMVQLQCLEFNRIGMAKINHPHDVSRVSSHEVPSTVGPSYHWPYSSNITEVVERGPFSTIQDFVQSGLQACFDAQMLREKYPELDENYYMKLGVKKIMEIVFNTAVFNPGDMDETFVVHHDDLDFQNILTDKEGNITGIIDWDGAFVGPRCIGPAAAPRFLTRDWFPGGHGEQLEKLPHMAWNTYRYRNIYAAAMHQAELKNGISRDAQYTTKSGIYDAALCAIHEGGNCCDFTDKILFKLPELLTDPYDFKVLLGQGFPAAEQMLEDEIAKFCQPALPGEEYFKELEEQVIKNTTSNRMDPTADNVEPPTPPTPDEELGGSEPSQDSPAETSTAVNILDPIPEEGKEPQTVLPSPSLENSSPSLEESPPSPREWESFSDESSSSSDESSTFSDDSSLSSEESPPPSKDSSPTGKESSTSPGESSPSPCEDPSPSSSFEESWPPSPCPEALSPSPEESSPSPSPSPSPSRGKLSPSCEELLPSPEESSPSLCEALSPSPEESSPSPKILGEDDDETELLCFLETTSSFSQESSSNKSSPTSTLGFEDGGHLQADSQLQSYPKFITLKVPTHLPHGSYFEQSSSGERYLIKALGKATEGGKAVQLPIPAIDAPKREG